jgi:hypothetical protein
MPYAIRGRVRPLPRKPKPRAPRRDLTVVPRATGSTLAAQLNGWAFQPKVYLAWDGPATPNPNWLDVTSFVDVTQGITITPGRTDGLSDPSSATCTFTVDNSDGRWIAGNPSGAWAGLIRKGIWIRVDILPLSGTLSRRFTGYITSLPLAISGLYAESQITASDQFVPLTQAPKYQSMIIHEWLSDPVGAQYIEAYFPLHEPAGATYVSDISGQAPVAAQSMAVRSHGVTSGGGITFASAPAPGFDQLSTVEFAPSGTLLAAVGSGATGSYPNGSYLQGQFTLSAVAQITCWIKTSSANQPIWSWSDPTANYAFGIQLDAAGYLAVWQGPLSGDNFTLTGAFGDYALSRYPLDDGVWHQVSIRIQTPAATDSGANAYYSAVVDGYQVWDLFGTSSPATGLCPPANQSRFLLGAAEGWTGDAQVTGYAMFTGAISDLVVHLIPTAPINPNWYSPYIASSTGHAGEGTGLRIARLVAYAGLPAPTTAFTLPGTNNTAYQAATGTSTAVSVGTTAHPAGVQTIAGTNPLDAIRAVAHTEFMPLYVDPYGRITVQASTVRQNASSSVTILQETDLDPSTAFADDYQYLVNQAQITPSGQAQLVVNTGGAASQALNGVYSTQLDTVSLNALEANSLGAAVIAGGAAPPPRPAPLAVEAATLAQTPGYGAAWYDDVLALGISGVVQVQNWLAESPYGAGGTSTHVIEGWTETIGEGTHLFAWATSPTQGATYQCDSPTLGLCDTPGITLAY